MIKANSSLGFIVLCGLSLSLISVEARAEKIPALVQISPVLPAEEQAAFRKRKATLESTLQAFVAASDHFNAKAAKDQTDAEFDALTAQRARYIASAQEYNSQLAARVKALESGDPMVVDARNVPSGLWQGMDGAIASAYADAPAGVSDRVRKGFQAVMDRDWKVAKAWFEDALNRDPDNVGLKRLVALAGSSVQPSQQPVPLAVRDVPASHGSSTNLKETSAPPSPPNPARFIPGTDIQLPDPDDVYFLFPGLKTMKENEMMDMLFGLDQPSPTQKAAKPEGANVQSMPLPPKAVLKPNWGAFFDALLKSPPRGNYRAVSSVRG